MRESEKPIVNYLVYVGGWLLLELSSELSGAQKKSRPTEKR